MSNARMSKCSNAERSNPQMFERSNVNMFECQNVQISKRSSVKTLECQIARMSNARFRLYEVEAIFDFNFTKPKRRSNLPAKILPPTGRSRWYLIMECATRAHRLDDTLLNGSEAKTLRYLLVLSTKSPLLETLRKMHPMFVSRQQNVRKQMFGCWKKT